MTPVPRTGAQRKADALSALTTTNADVWVASAGENSVAHLVPLSFAWDGGHVILATEAAAATARNIRASGLARLGFGTTRDVVMVDARLIRVVPDAASEPAVTARYADQADWDPREAAGDFVYLLLRPDRVQVWREANEIDGRTIMRDGQWLA
jgi:hypothetical protein